MSNQLLREFIRENIGMMFGLDRHVTMNALSDTLSGPHPIDSTVTPEEPVTSLNVFKALADEMTSVVDHLSPDQTDDIDDQSELE